MKTLKAGFVYILLHVAGSLVFRHFGLEWYMATTEMIGLRIVVAIATVLELE